MVNAFRAGTIVAVVAAVIGWFMVLRRQTFAGHTLVARRRSRRGRRDAGRHQRRVGLFAFCIAAALVIAARPARPRARAAARSPPSSARSRRSRSPAASCSSASTAGSSTARPRCCSAASSASPTARSSTLLVGRRGRRCVVLAVIGRPLLFASVDPDVAAARGVPVRALSVLLPRRCSASRSPRPARSPARCSSSRCSSSPPPPRSSSPPGRSLSLAPQRRDRPRRSRGSGSRSPYYSTYPVGFCITTLAFGAYVARARRPLDHATGRDRRRRPDDALLATPPAPASPTCSRTRSCATRSSPAPRSPPPCGLVGYFVVLRSQVFTGDALSHVAFTGALAALAFGVDARLGLFAATIAVGARASACSATAAAPTTSSSAPSSPGSSASACCSSASTPRRRAPATAPPASTCCSARSSGSAPAKQPSPPGSVSASAWP